MELRTGSDIVYIPRFKRILARTPAFAEKIFLPEERKDKNTRQLAGIFAAKEAVMKALGVSAGKWLFISIGHQETGKPVLTLRMPRPVRYRAGDISIAHDGKYAFACAVFVL